MADHSPDSVVLLQQIYVLHDLHRLVLVHGTGCPGVAENEHVLGSNGGSRDRDPTLLATAFPGFLVACFNIAGQFRSQFKCLVTGNFLCTVGLYDILFSQFCSCTFGLNNFVLNSFVLKQKESQSILILTVLFLTLLFSAILV